MAQPRPDGRLPAGLDRDRVLAALTAAVGDLAHLGNKTPEWGVGTPNREWTLLDLAGHILGVARYHHRLLTAAEAGRPLRDLPTGAALDDLNAAELSALEEVDGPERLLAYEAVARRYGERLADADWTVAMGTWSGVGTLTIGEHALAATAEWQLHTWDVARSFGWDHTPDDPEVGLAGQRLLGPHAVGVAPLPSNPWTAALLGSGRRPRRR